MKRTSIVLFALFLSLSAFCQTRMLIKKTSGATDTLLLWGISNISFKNVSPPPPASIIVYVGQFGGNNEIWKMNADGTSKMKIASIAETYMGGVSISPDRSRIAYYAGAANAYNIYVMNMDGSNKTKITTPNSTYLYYYSPLWISNTSLHVNIARTGDEGKRDVIKMDADGTNIVYLTQSSTRSIGRLALSPSGTKVAFAEGNPYNGAVTEVYTADYPSFANKVLLADPAAPGGEEVCSWAGNSIYFWSSFSTNNRLYKINDDKSNLVQLTPAGSTHEFFAVISPDGNQIGYVSGTNNVYNIYSMSLAGTNRTAITNFTSTTDVLNNFDWK